MSEQFKITGLSWMVVVGLVGAALYMGGVIKQVDANTQAITDLQQLKQQVLEIRADVKWLVVREKGQSRK